MVTFNTVWSVDLGKASLKAVRLRREGNYIEILGVDKIDYSVDQNGVDPVQKGREALNAFRIRNDVRDPVVVAHPGQGTFSRFIKVPAFDSKKLKEMVGYEASQQIPFPLDEVIWDYHVINREYVSGEEREVGIFAVRREAIDDYLLDFTNEGLSVEVLSIGYLGLLNYILYDLSPQEPSIVIDIGATHTDLILVDGKKFWIRALPHSGNDINKAIMERFKVSFQEAEKLKIESGKVPQQAVKIFSSVIQPKLKELVGEIHRSTGYYRSQAGDIKFQQLFLLGNGSKIFGIKKYLSEQLGLEVHRIQSIRHFRVNRDVDLKLLQNELPAFGTAFGCALQGVNAGACRVDLIPQEERIQKDIRRKKKHIFIALGIVFLAIVLTHLFLNGRVKTALESVQEHKDFIRKEIDPFIPKKGGELNIIEIIRRGKELEKVAAIRSLAFDALRSLGAVVPKDNEAVVVEKEDAKKKVEAELRAKGKVAEINKKKIFIPWLKVERVDWPEAAAAGPTSTGATREKKKGPTVPAYKVTVFGAVVQQGDVDSSLALLRKLLIDPMEKKLKESAASEDASKRITIDYNVTVSSDYKNEAFTRLAYRQKVGERGGPEVRGPRGVDVDTAQEAGPFFGTEISWYLRLEEPKEEVQEKKAKEEPEEDTKIKKKKAR